MQADDEGDLDPMTSFGPGRVVKPVGKQRFRGWEVVGEATIEVCAHPAPAVEAGPRIGGGWGFESWG